MIKIDDVYPKRPSKNFKFQNLSLKKKTNKLYFAAGDEEEGQWMKGYLDTRNLY